LQFFCVAFGRPCLSKIGWIHGEEKRQRENAKAGQEMF
jgi:hypothetical protein